MGKRHDTEKDGGCIVTGTEGMAEDEKASIPTSELVVSC